MPRSVQWIGVIVVMAAMGCRGDERVSPTFTIAAALPFTGNSGSLGFAREHAMIWAMEQVNALGGAGGRQLVLKTFDTHTDLVSGYQATGDALSIHPIAVIGPDNPALFAVAVNSAQAAGVLELTPSESFEPTNANLVNADVWLRLCPSIETMATSIAQRAYGDGMRDALVCATQDDYGQVYTRYFSSEFANLGGSVHAFPLLDATDVDEQIAYQLALNNQTDMAFVSMAPSPGAAFVNALGLQVSTSGSPLHGWYFSPSFDNDLFVHSKIPSIAANGVGVSPVLASNAADFASAYAQRWGGERPNNDEYYYYDAVILLALSIDVATHQVQGTPTSLQVRDAMKGLGSQHGAQVGWNDLQTAMDAARSGDDLTYVGATGVVQFAANGDRSGLQPAFWRFSPEGDSIAHP